MTDAEILSYIKQAGANWGEENQYGPWFGAFKTAIEAAVLAEREAIAKMFEGEEHGVISAAIRARGE